MSKTPFRRNSLTWFLFKCSSTSSSGSRQDCRPSCYSVSSNFADINILYIRTVPKPSPIRPHASSRLSTRVGAKPGTKIKLIKQKQTHNFLSDLLQRNEFQILPTKAWLSGGTDTAWVAMAAAGLRAGSVIAKDTPWLLVHVKSL